MIEHLNLLGHKVEDKVTGYKGIVTSISFDLYGCIQAIINPGKEKDGKLGEQLWFDVTRLKILSKHPVMNKPNYENVSVSKGEKGAAEKPKVMNN